MKRLFVTAACVAGSAVMVVASAQQVGGRPSYWPATTGEPVVDEWYSDVPWHQKLGTFAGNEIDQALVMPYAVLDENAKSVCKGKNPPWSDGRCMIEYGVNNVLGMRRTDTRYADGLDAEECKKGQPCIEVKLQLSSFHASPTGSQNTLVARLFGTETIPYNGYVITDASTYGPQMPWYMAHYCDAFPTPGKDVQDPVCYGDYLSPMNAAFNSVGLDATHWPKSVAWSVYPSTPNNHCAPNLTTCTMVMAGFNMRGLRSNLQDPDFQYAKYNNFLFTWFNNALTGFKTDFSEAQRQRHFPWDAVEAPKWETFYYPQGMQNPFLGEYDAGPTGEAAFAAGCDVTLTGAKPGVDPCNNTAVERAKSYAYPRQCTLADLAAGDAAKLRNCGLNYELHHNGWKAQWPSQYYDPSWMDGNQYGRTSFLFAGIPGMQMPVSFYKDPASPSGLSIYEQVHNSSLFSLYLPIANEADTKRAFPGRNYTDVEFYHTLLMSNHMESDPWQFAEGIRGKALWHNEYRTQKMYESYRNGKAAQFPDMHFPAGFDAATAKAPFHSNTCDSCHVRNGSGVPINTAKMLDATMKFMKRAVYNPYDPVKDYTFTGEIRPMKLVLFDLQRKTARLDGSRYSEPLALTPNMVAKAPRTMGDDLFYNNKVMNYYGDSFHVTAPGFGYSWNYVAAPQDQLVVKTTRRNAELGIDYTPWQAIVGGFLTPSTCAIVTPNPSTKPWPESCADVSGPAVEAAIKDGQVGYILLNGKRLGNSSAIEAMPNAAIMGFAESQRQLLGDRIAGEIIWTNGSRDGVTGAGSKVHRDCRKKSLNDCFIGRFGWLGDRASLEDQVANAAFVEMNMTTTEGYNRLYPHDEAPFPIRYAHPNCGPANLDCVNSRGNSDLTEQDVTRMADYARWVGNPTRSEFTVALPEVVAGEKLFRNLQCDTCHVINRIDIDPEDTMTSRYFRERMAKHRKDGNRPFLSYLGTDLLMHDMGYLSQVGNPKQPFRDAEGVVLPGFENYVQKIRTPALKGMRFNRFVTGSHKNTNSPQDPACDFLMHDGRACDAIEAAFIHDGPAVRKLGIIEKLNALSVSELRQLRAFLYSL